MNSKRTSTGSSLTTLSFFVLVLSIQTSFLAESASAQTKYGRTAASGAWSDSNWISEFGTTFSSPTATDEVYIGDATTISGATEPASITVGATHEIDAVTLGNNVAGNLTISGSGNLTVAKDLLVQNGVFDLQSGGAITADRLFFDGANATGTLSGTYIANTLIANNGANLSLNSAPAVASALSSIGGSISVNASSTLQTFNTINANATLNASSTANQMAFSDSTVELNADVDVGNDLNFSGSLEMNGAAISANRVFFQDDSSGGALNFQRIGGSINAENVSVLTGITYDVAAADNFNGLTLSNGAVANLNRAMTLTGNVTVNQNSTLNLDGDLVADALSLNGPDAVLNRSPGDQFSVRNFTIEGGSYTYDGTDSISGSLSVFTGASVQVDSELALSGLLQTFNGDVEINEAVDVGSLFMLGGSVTANEASEFGSATLFSGSTFTFNQQNGDDEGITFDSLTMLFGSLVEINFGSDSSLAELDWGLRVAGDNQVALQSLLDNGQIVVGGGNGASIGLVYDTNQFGDYTYLGITAIPEPTSMAILMTLGFGSVWRRRRS